MADFAPKPQLSLTSVALADAARLLAKVSGQPISTAMLETDIAAGAPANPDGTLNLIAYAAWLVREVVRGER